MKPIKIKYRDSKNKEAWGLWIDTTGNKEAVILPIGITNPTPFCKSIVNIQVISQQNDHLNLNEPQV